MKALFLSAILVLSSTAFGQYYYKDIVGTKETAGIIKAYQASKVSRVLLNSFDEDGTKTENFYVEQIFSPATQTLKTITRTGENDESTLISYINDKGQVVKTVDSSQGMVSIAQYRYDDEGRLLSFTSTSSDSSHRLNLEEEHLWRYKDDRIDHMLRIKNKVDTAVVTFKFDENGNLVEENSARRGVKSEPVYYYYDAQNRLTDIVRYNNKVRKLLPEYMFEYSSNNQVIQKMTFPANSSEYLIWRYQYDDRGLKVKEAVFNKQKQLNGKIEYIYSFGS
jgi:antitoxin component YwqK of YwqJK toxin-antitoxin module